ncbi:hypothetical protein KXD40_008289 [Peronospora effusa]|uniref:Phosphorylated adapter RNA export protein n=1 Tax=Peronospora effusa TaxID=542832 RepID=A0A3M6VG18_9STRA|nr:hypothetical protein DD238_006456 [Peronospora effusa]RQM13787.1 hypothetical protein DD237_005319 [Peronospora effusa]UIZ24067.1 hypothetical protein KXD40_008289 [Peronospora effusa]CAI5707682.1 unnamed protein product [Peronospora effusa]
MTTVPPAPLPMAPVDVTSDSTPTCLSWKQQRPKKQYKQKQKKENGSQPLGNNKSKRRCHNLKQPLTKDMPRLLSMLLKEPKVALLHRVVKNVGPKLSWQLLRETLRLEKDGGQSVNAEASGKPELFFVVDEVSHEYKPRRRTSGGVFFTLLKEKVSKEVYRTIYEVEDRKKKDAKKRARSRQRQKMDKTLAKLGFDDLTLVSEDKDFTKAYNNKIEAPVAFSGEAVDVIVEDGEVAEDMQIT